MIDLQAPVDSKILADLQALVEQQAAIIKAQALHIEKLTFELATLKRRLFGRSSEAADTLTVQGQLFALPETVEIKPATAPKLPRTPAMQENAKQQPKRELLPPGLPHARNASLICRTRSKGAW